MAGFTIFLGANYTPQDLLNSSDDELRSLGLSRSKVSYVKAVAEAAGENAQNFKDFHSLSNEEVLKILTDIRGIGVWSAQMFLMFQLRRQDVFAPGDLGLRKAMSLLYGYTMDGSDKIWEERAEQWAPFRTLASLHLWKTLA